MPLKRELPQYPRTHTEIQTHLSPWQVAVPLMMVVRWVPLLALLAVPAASALPQAGGTPAAAADKVDVLPGWAAPLPSDHYSGYLPAANGEKLLHYYLQEAEADVDAAPLVLWMNGGPGASSLIGAFTELGQLVFNRDSMPAATTSNASATATGSNNSSAAGDAATPTLFRNPFAWTTVASVLYLESPAGVGFSKCVDPELKCTSTDNSSASGEASEQA